MTKDTFGPDRVGLIVDTLAPLGDYLREHNLVTGYGFEQTPEGFVYRFQDCRFADTLHRAAEEGVACNKCPVFRLMEAALQKRDSHSSLRDNIVFSEDALTCVFRLDIVPVAKEIRTQETET